MVEINTKFGSLTYLKRLEYSKSCHTFRCLVVCDCSIEFELYENNLKSGKSTRCKDCSHKVVGEKKTKHGHHKNGKASPIYKAWQHFKGRCYVETDSSYSEYGGRGISVCEEWLHPESGSSSFIKWSIDNGWEPGLEINRVDNNGNYCPENCEWTTKKRNGRNRRVTFFVDYKGSRYSLGEAVDLYSPEGIKPNMVWNRIDDGWDVHRALTTPKREYFRS